MFEFTCSVCGEVHRGAPSFSVAAPAQALFLPPSEQADRVELSDDLCIIRPHDRDPYGEPMYFIRATLAIPIQGARRPFTWSLWVSQTEECFYDYADSLGTDQRGVATLGDLTVSLPIYDDRPDGEPFADLPCTVEWGDAGKRPKIVLPAGNHPLLVDIHEGMAEERAAELSEIMLHP
jgi:hypothetical protein